MQKRKSLALSNGGIPRRRTSRWGKSDGERGVRCTGLNKPNFNNEVVRFKPHGREVKLWDPGGGKDLTRGGRASRVGGTGRITVVGVNYSPRSQNKERKKPP